MLWGYLKEQSYFRPIKIELVLKEVECETKELCDYFETNGSDPI